MDSKFPWAKKKFGQHFLIHTPTIEKMTKEVPEGIDHILEVGPGPAVLSQHLVKHNLPFVVLEKDPDFKEELEKYLPSDRIIIQDALNFTSEHLNEFFPDPKKLWLVSNLPYNVGSVLFVNFLQFECVQAMTLMFQKEVGEKILPPQGSKKKSNSLMALSQNFFEVKKLTLVPPGAFVPPPKIESIVLSFKRKPNPVIALKSFTKYEKFLRLCFSQKRKKLQNLLKAQFSDVSLAKSFEKLQINASIRAEVLDLQLLQDLFKELMNEH